MKLLSPTGHTGVNRTRRDAPQGTEGDETLWGSGQVPHNWKNASVTPIFKDGEDSGNCKPQLCPSESYRANLPEAITILLYQG